MREIKFRGETSAGEWKYGDLIKLPEIFREREGKPYTREHTKFGICSFEIDFYEGAISQVLTDTVGQYTGLKDKNGVEIYEGDIVKFNRIGKKIVGVMKYAGCGFTCDAKGIGYNLGIETLITDCNAEVIGNIHEHKIVDGEVFPND